MMDKIYILLPVFNRKTITEKIVKCLCKQSFQNYHLILIDDGSTDGTTEMVQSYIKAENLTVIRGVGDWWCFGSFQQGINWLKGKSIHPQDTILLINDDVTFEEDFLETARLLLKDRINTLLLAQCLSEQTGILVDSGVCANLKTLKFNQAKSQDEINCLSTRGLFMRWQDLLKIGDFYPRLLPHYTGDYEYTMRAYRKGLRLCTEPSLRLWLNEETTGFQDYSDLSFAEFLRKFFSKKSMLSPIYWTPFIILTCPNIWIPINIARVWTSAFLRICRHAFLSIANYARRSSFY
jgi:glycosyltransferase involved in cell wall biosynthesis